jgi:hypothetical protein
MSAEELANIINKCKYNLFIQWVSEDISNEMRDNYRFALDSLCNEVNKIVDSKLE